MVRIRRCGGLARKYFVKSEMYKEGECIRRLFRVCEIHCQRNPNLCVAMKGENNTTNCVDNQNVVSLSVDIHVKGEKCVMERGLYVAKYTIHFVPMK